MPPRWLQWGLRLSTEEGKAIGEYVIEWVKLQWGLRLSTEEGCDAHDIVGLDDICFNGASVFQRRKVANAQAGLLEKGELQWGLRLSTEEGFRINSSKFR